MDDSNIKRNNIEQSRIRNYSEVDAGRVQELFEGFKVDSGRGGNRVTFTRTGSEGDVREFPSPTFYPPGEEITLKNDGEIVTSPSHHRESSFTKEQLLYVDLLNRLLIDILKKDFKQEVLSIYKIYEDDKSYEFNRKDILSRSLKLALVEMVRKLCELYPHLLPAIQSFFLIGGANGLETSISRGFLKKELTKADFIGFRPNLGEVVEFELMCGGMAVAFEVMDIMQKIIIDLGFSEEETEGISIDGINLKEQITNTIKKQLMNLQEQNKSY